MYSQAYKIPCSACKYVDWRVQKMRCVMSSAGSYCYTAKESKSLKNKVMCSNFIPCGLLTWKPNQTYIFTKSRKLRQRSSRKQEQIKFRSSVFPSLRFCRSGCRTRIIRIQIVTLFLLVSIVSLTCLCLCIFTICQHMPSIGF